MDSNKKIQIFVLALFFLVIGYIFISKKPDQNSDKVLNQIIEKNQNDSRFFQFVNNIKQSFSSEQSNQSVNQISSGQNQSSSTPLNQTVTATPPNSNNGTAVTDYSGVYYALFNDSIKDISFSQAEFSSLKKDLATGRPLSIEELLDKLANGESQSSLNSSFLAWKNMDETTIAKLKSLPMTSNMSRYNNELLTWYEYRKNLITDILNRNISAQEAGQILQSHLDKAKISAPKFAVKDQSEKFSLFELIVKKVNAQGAFYHFGGRITSIGDTCTNGIAIEVGPPKGGELWIYYPVLAANPYLYKNLMPTACVLGRATWGPGVCNKGTANYLRGIASILYFGSSPAICK